MMTKNDSEMERKAYRKARRICVTMLQVPYDWSRPFSMLDTWDRGTTGDRFREKRQRMQKTWAARIQENIALN